MIDLDAAYRRYKPGLWRAALRKVRSPQEAEEIVQMTFVRAIEARDTYREEYAVSTWLYAILRSVMATGARKGRIDFETLNRELLLQGRPPSAVDQLEGHEEYARIMSSITVREREALDLLLSGLKQREIAEKMGTTRKAITSAFFRMNVRLKKE